MTATSTLSVKGIRKETNSLGRVHVPNSTLFGAQTQRSLEPFSIGQDLIQREMIAAYATLEKAAASAHHAGRWVDHAMIRIGRIGTFGGDTAVDITGTPTR